MVRFDFTGKVAIVTGSGGGIGQAYAEALAAAGASVMVADIAEDNAAAVAAAIVASGGTAESIRVDVADPESAQAMAERTVERFGGIDYLVNNAAIFGGMQLDLLLTVDWEYLNRFLSVNMLGALNCMRACYPAMKARGGGAIVNQSSTAAYLYAGFYGLAKAGVNSITQQLAHELGGQNIRTNAIAPGPIDTEASRTRGPRCLHEADPGLPGPQAAGPDLGPGGHVPVPAVRRGLVDHRPRLQRRRRPGGPPVSEGRVDVEDDAGVRLIAFDRPEVRNAFDAAMYGAVTGALAAALADDGIRVGGADRTGEGVHRRPGPPRDGGHGHRCGRPGGGLGIPGLDGRGRLLRQAAAGRGQRRGRGTGLHPARPTWTWS